MAGPLSNPARRTEPSGGARVKSNASQKKRAGTTKRPGIPVTGPTKARAVTMTGVGTEDKNAPESGRARQDAANGTVHGQPRSGYNDGNNISR
jgi:hypothetical protein